MSALDSEELNKAVAVEVMRRLYRGLAVRLYGEDFTDALALAARLARENWTPTDPLLIRAREIVADEERRHGTREAEITEILSGEHDDSFTISCALSALRGPR